MAEPLLHQDVQLPALADRERVLEDLHRLISRAWESFDHPRPTEPGLDEIVVAAMDAGLPARPGAVGPALADATHLLDASISPSRPLYLAYIGSTGLEIGVLASALAATYDVNLASSAGGAELIERQAIAWAGQLVGYGVAEGVFTSGGMTSNLTALLAAREYALPGSREDGLFGARAAVYCSAEAHHSVVRAVEAMGLGRSAVRMVAQDRLRRMDPADLRARIAADVDAGVVPVAVVATAGTTLTGAVDPLDAIADVCADVDPARPVWLHVDGAYGLPAAATDHARALFAGLDRADSVTLDAHKWLGVQKSCSAVLLRATGHLQQAFAHDERYMLHEGDQANPVDRTLEYSRPLRSLRLWLALRVHGADQYRAWITHTLRLADRLAAQIRADDDFELLHEPMLSTLCFRHRSADNVALADAIQRDGRVFLAAAMVDDQPCLRVTFVNFRTTEEETDLVLTVARELAQP